ncbi:MAG: glycosyltransferase family 2 protein [Bacillota bacterium]
MKEQYPLVSVVVPSYNQGKFIKDTIESILNQDYPNIELIVMDGASTDNTVEILKSYGDKFYWQSKKDKGQSDAINQGWKISKGSILAWLNSDDTYLPGALSKVVNYFKNNPHIHVVYGEGYHTFEDGTIMERYPTESFNAERLKETCFICQPTVFMRKEALLKVDFVNEKLNYCMDYDLWLRLAKDFQFGYIGDYLATSRLYADNKTLGQKERVHAEIIEMLYKNLSLVPAPWIYGYAHALLETKYDRSNSSENFKFITNLIFISAKTFCKYNKKLPLGELRRMASWFSHGLLKRWGLKS